MRIVSALAGLVTLTILSQPISAFALQASTTMSNWKKASAVDQGELLDRLDLGGAAKGAIKKCLDDTASAPGHGDLPIGEIVTACVKMGNPGQPV